ncbi:hypothetical protein [Novosphingobium olei]|uniref:Uncharacterized protein n=1 Tax=Novosphingobium olei TaxID=2728851 RepID=A0A7Y0BT10_9SPHN|nr:hypothetical protein [Novosphingobium olei]NML95386.1 hypothetical protein [Novosphingobium olei]
MGKRERLVLVGAMAAICIAGAAEAKPVAHRPRPVPSAVAAVPSTSVAPTLPPLAHVSLLVDLPRSAKAGARAAGMLCLPNGAVRVVDLVGRDQALEATVRAALARAGEARLRGRGEIEIHLTDVSVKLCARNWGAFGMGGDHGALSGEARYAFRWRRGGAGPAMPVEIAFGIDRHAPMTAGEITGRALDLLFDRIIPAA